MFFHENRVDIHRDRNMYGFFFVYTPGYRIYVTMVTGSEITSSRSDLAMTKSLKNELKTGFFRKFPSSKLQIRSKNELSVKLARFETETRRSEEIFIEFVFTALTRAYGKTVSLT